MLTTNRSYDVDFYHRPGQAMNYVLRNQPLCDNYGHSAFSSTGDSPAPDIEGKPAVTHRKRVPVACDRCRKRKIKCSGDQGNGSGCDNCKSAGYEGCQFLRVRSEALACHPGYNSSRWHGSHYHPYSRSHNTSVVQQSHLQQSHHSPQYVQQHILPYMAWENSIDCGGIPAATPASIPWNGSHFNSNYQLYEAEPTSQYATHSRACMSPEPGSETRSGVHYARTSLRPQQNPTWLESMNRASISQHNSHNVSQLYPLTPVESTQSYSLFGRSMQSGVSYERNLPTPNLPSVQQMIPLQGRDTPPLSAMSHRSSHTWTTDSASNLSVTSSRTSCGGSRDLTAAAQGLIACGEAVIYPLQTDETSPNLDIPVAQLPTTAQDHEHQIDTQTQPSQSNSSHDMAVVQLRTRSSVESLRSTSSPRTYNYPPHQTMTRRGRGLIPSRLLTNFGSNLYPFGWSQSPSTASSRQDSVPTQSVLQPPSAISEEYDECTERDNVPVLSATY